MAAAPTAYPARMQIAFVHRGLPGRVDVSCEATSDPAVEGALPEAKGLPHLRPDVDYAGHGYDAFFGWVQLVRSTDNQSGGRDFEMDPFALFEDAPSPYCFFGLTPSLFDAPARSSRARMDWLAHSFLAYTPLDAERRPVLPLLGFSWGFTISDHGEVTIEPVKQLESPGWSGHVPFLEATYPGWTFGPGFDQYV